MKPNQSATAFPVDPSAGATGLPPRLYSLDALRGFDMFWIMGAEGIVESLKNATHAPFWEGFATQLSHPDWNGFHMYDLIFPMFLFIAGCATPFSVGRELEKGKTRQQLLMRVIKRGLILVLLGIIYNNGLVIRPLDDIRFGSVLGRIGLAYMFANIIYLYTKKQSTQIIWFCGLLIGYWALLKFTSAPGFAMGDLTMQGNIASFIDRSVLPGRLYLGIHDPEGLTSTIPAIGTGLLGIMTGVFLKKETPKDPGKLAGLIVAAAAAVGILVVWKTDIYTDKTPITILLACIAIINPFLRGKAAWLGITGAIFIFLAALWNFNFPVNKNLWTSSFVLMVGGLSLTWLGLFYYIIDVKGYKKWAFFFKIIGMNSILIYMSGQFLNWEYTTNSFFHWLGQFYNDAWAAVVLSICYVMVKWCFLYFMYKKKVFLRV